LRVLAHGFRIGPVGGGDVFEGGFLRDSRGGVGFWGNELEMGSTEENDQKKEGG
jgi:hypothetical protein